MDILQIILLLFYAYILAGILFAVYFMLKGAAQRDEAARGISWKTKALLFPGSVALWLLLIFNKK